MDKNFEALCGEFILKHEQHTGSIPSTERVTRFLCGISVPLFTKLKARSIAGYAVLEEYPYGEVREWVETHLQA
jgi:ATP-dependent DNA helicase RecQ